MSKEINRMERKKANTKEKIFHTAITLFEQKGYENTTVDEIAQKADVAKGTFFNYFPKKSSLLIYLIQKNVDALPSRLETEIADKPLSAKKKIIKLIELLASDYDHKNSELSKSLLLESFKNYGDLIYEENINQVKVINILEKIITEGKANNEISNEVNTQMLTELIIGTYFYSIFLWVFGKKNIPLLQDLTSKIEFILEVK